MDKEQSTKQLTDPESGIKESISTHFSKRKEQPIKAKKKGILLKMILIMLLISAVLLVISVLVYTFFIKGYDASEATQQQAEEQNVVEQDNDSQEVVIDKDAYENQDEDGDGLTTLQELELGTKTDEADSDFDNMPDGWEVIYNLDPLVYNDALEDGDEDKLTNIEEYEYQTDPTDPDTDKDGFLDGDEVSNGFNPNGKGKLNKK